MSIYSLIKPYLKPTLAGCTLLAAFSLPVSPRDGARAQIDGVCVMFCDDGGSSGGTTYGGGGYGGGGCAAMDPYAGYAGPSYIGEYHPEHSNVVWDGQHWAPADGYEWVSSDQHDWRVQRQYGSSHPDQSNVYWNGEKWSPRDGYTWLNDTPGDFRVIGPWDPHPEYPHVIWNGEKWQPETGYAWKNNDPDDFSVAAPLDHHGDYPHVVWNGANWTPESGYTWANDTPGDYSVIGPGDRHPDFSHVLWSGDKWSAEEGYVWLNDDPDDLRVISVEEATLRQQQAEIASLKTELAGALPSDRGLRVSDVPSPSGYRTARERQAQLDRMTDDQIETELARIQSTLYRMQQDFQNNSADLGDWLKEAEQAEFDALKDSFGLLVGGSLERFKDIWDSYPKLKAIASNGLDYAGKLELSMKVAEDPNSRENQLEMMREMMMDVHKTIVEEGEALLSESGPMALAFSKFVVDYSYHATRWGIARNRILAISENLDNPNGALAAQQAISTLQEELMEEKVRRRSLGSQS